MGIEVMGKWEWESSVGIGMGGNDSMEVRRELKKECHSRTPLDSQLSLDAVFRVNPMRAAVSVQLEAG